MAPSNGFGTTARTKPRARPLVKTARTLRIAFFPPLGADALMPTECASAYLLRTGTMPKLGTETPPWTYRGWLRVYVQMLQARGYGGFPDRWGYMRRMVEEQRLPDEPIPEVEFKQNTGVLKKTEKWIELVARGAGHWTAMERFIRFLAYALDVSDTPSDLSTEICEELYKTVNLGDWLERPADYLGEAACALGGGPNKFYPTPLPLCEVIVSGIMGPQEGQDLRLKSVYDPALGSGRMLLLASNYSLRLSGQDIDEMMVLMAKINFCVYAPWALHRLPFLDRLAKQDGVF